MSSGSSVLFSTKRISIGLDSVILPLLDWQRELEGSTLTHGALCPDPTAVPLDDSPHEGEADPSSLEFTFVVQAPERVEQPVGVLPVEPDTIVSDRETSFTGIACDH